MLKRILLLVVLLLPGGTALADAAPAPPANWVVLGDSISAAYGIPVSQGWVALLQQRLQARGIAIHVINASVSGETSAGGLARLPALLARHQPRLVLIELGGNDGLRGLPVAKLRDNLQQMVALSQRAGARSVLFEMRIPSNYGPAYVDQFVASFGLVARQAKVPLAPFLLGPIATDATAFQADGIHPIAAVQNRLLDAVWPTLEPLAR